MPGVNVEEGTRQSLLSSENEEVTNPQKVMIDVESSIVTLCDDNDNNKNGLEPLQPSPSIACNNNNNAYNTLSLGLLSSDGVFLPRRSPLQIASLLAALSLSSEPVFVNLGGVYRLPFEEYHRLLKCQMIYYGRSMTIETEASSSSSPPDRCCKVKCRHPGCGFLLHTRQQTITTTTTIAPWSSSSSPPPLVFQQVLETFPHYCSVRDHLQYALVDDEAFTASVLGLQQTATTTTTTADCDISALAQHLRVTFGLDFSCSSERQLELQRAWDWARSQQQEQQQQQDEQQQQEAAVTALDTVTIETSFTANDTSTNTAMTELANTVETPTATRIVTDPNVVVASVASEAIGSDNSHTPLHSRPCAKRKRRDLSTPELHTDENFAEQDHYVVLHKSDWSSPLLLAADPEKATTTATTTTTSITATTDMISTAIHHVQTPSTLISPSPSSSRQDEKTSLLLLSEAPNYPLGGNNNVSDMVQSNNNDNDLARSASLPPPLSYEMQQSLTTLSSIRKLRVVLEGLVFESVSTTSSSSGRPRKQQQQQSANGTDECSNINVNLFEGMQTSSLWFETGQEASYPGSYKRSRYSSYPFLFRPSLTGLVDAYDALEKEGLVVSARLNTCSADDLLKHVNTKIKTLQSYDEDADRNVQHDEEVQSDLKDYKRSLKKLAQGLEQERLAKLKDEEEHLERKIRYDYFMRRNKINSNTNEDALMVAQLASAPVVFESSSSPSLSSSDEHQEAEEEQQQQQGGKEAILMSDCNKMDCACYWWWDRSEPPPVLMAAKPLPPLPRYRRVEPLVYTFDPCFAYGGSNSGSSSRNAGTGTPRMSYQQHETVHKAKLSIFKLKELRNSIPFVEQFALEGRPASEVSSVDDGKDDDDKDEDENENQYAK